MELETTAKVPVERLRLDRESPRLVGETLGTSDDSIIAHLYRAAALDELLQSISASGYLDIESLVVMRDGDAGDDGLIVLEGNRRLAALRLLREPALASRIVIAEGTSLTVPDVDESIRETLDHVSVYPVADRECARAFIGFKHMNGPLKWNAYGKARFAAEWYRKGGANGPGLEGIAEAIGDRLDTVRRMVSALYVLEQAQSEGLFEIEDRRCVKFNFAHLYTALAHSEYIDYLGLEAGSRSDPKREQVPRERLGRLKQVLRWIYGSRADDLEPVVQAQNPDVRRLGQVLASAQGRQVLEHTRSLDYAHASTEPADGRFGASLLRARDAMREAASSLRAYDGRDRSLLGCAEDVQETAEAIRSRMAKKRLEAV